MNQDHVFQAPLAAALKYALDHLSSLAHHSVAATVDVETLRDRLARPLEENGLDPTQVVNELALAVQGGLLGSPGPRFFGWVVGGALPAALAADWLTSAWDQNASMYASAPAASVVEEVAGVWLKDVLHLPASASFALVTGCQMAHLTCLAAARNSLLARRNWNVESDGLAGAPSLRILTSTEKHGTVARAARFLGFGERSIVTLPVDGNGRLREDALIAAFQGSPAQATILVLQAGDLNIGAFDSFASLIPIARTFGAWVHVDGAFGLWAAASSHLRYLLKGVEAADSWATDGHKWLNVPYDSGYAFIADAAAHRASFAIKASYLTHDNVARDQIDWTPEWSRRGRGFATYAALRQLGKTGVAELVERCCACTRDLVNGIGSLPGAEVVRDGQINQGLVRFVPPRKHVSEADCDTFTERVIAEILASGEAFFTATTWRHRRAMRVSVCNWQTSPKDVERVIHCIAAILRRAYESTGAVER